MSQILEKIKSNASIVTIVLLLVFSITQCNMNSNMKSMKKDVTNRLDSLENVIVDMESKMANKEFVHKSNQNTMYEFLIFEDDIDKGKMSLSDVRLRLDKPTTVTNNKE